MVNEEETLRSAKARGHAHLHSVREIALPVGGKLAFLAAEKGFFGRIDTSGRKPVAEIDDVVMHGSSELEETPAGGGIATYYWSVHCHKMPRRRLLVPGEEGEGDSPSISISSIDVARYIRVDLEIADNRSDDDMSSGPPRGPKRRLRLLVRRNEFRQVVARTARI